MSDFTIAPEDSGIRLDRWFKRHMPGVPHALLEKALRKGQVRLDGKKAESSTRLEAGQVLRVDDILASMEHSAPRPKKTAAPPAAEQVESLRRLILYEDAMLLAINKPAGLAVQGGSGQVLHVDALLPYIREKADVKLVHRLDKDTSGVLLLAKGAQAAAKLARLFAGKDVQKIYLALVAGVPRPREGKIDLPLIKEERGKHSGMKAAYEAVGVNAEKGRRAMTEYVVKEHIGNKLAWVELKPITGRTHQLRVHMAAVGCPIVGDGKYGGPDAFMDSLGLPPTLHLHAQRIILPAWQGKTLEIRAPLPAHMRESQRILNQ